MRQSRDKAASDQLSRGIKGAAVLIGALTLSLLPQRTAGFSLLGPYAEWMEFRKGYQQSGDIGGPMNIGEGYRWNIPMISYGFDRSFLDYFGSNGVAAVESAVAIINQVPPASVLDPQSYPPAVWRENYRAQAWGVADLKSQALNTLLEEMGLSDSVRWTFCLRDLQLVGTNYLFYVAGRNFDPLSGQPSSSVNGTAFTYHVYQYPAGSSEVVFDAVELIIDPLQPICTAAVQHPPFDGAFAIGLSRDDVGGLRYLLNQNQVLMEDLLGDVHLAGTNGGNLVTRAYRAGIEKITLVRHPYGSLSGEFQPFTNRWTDIYYDCCGPAYQDVERVTTEPDILFRGQDLGLQTGWIRTGTTNWANNADLNANNGGAGPGVIRPPIVISFNTIGPFYINTTQAADEFSSILVNGWGSFDGSTNLPIVYPNVQIPYQSTQVRFELVVGNAKYDFSWALAGPAYGQFLFQTASNLTDWSTLTTLTNSGAEFDYQYAAMPGEPSRFFRTVSTP